MDGIECKEVGTGYRPTLAAVGSFEDDLAAVVDGVVVEGINGQRRSPVAAVFDSCRRRVQGVQPGADGARHFVARIPAGDFVAVAGGPYDVGIGEVGEGKTGFAAAHVVVPAGIGTVAVTHGGRVAGPAHGAIILHVAVNVVGDLVVHGDVIHLADGQSDV